MRWQPAVIFLGLIALSLVDLSSIAGATSGPALDAAISLAASQVGVAAMWLALGRSALLVRLAGTGLLVNTWASALPELGASLVLLLVCEVAGVVILLAGLRLAGFELGGTAMRRSQRRPRQWSLAETLAITAIVGIAAGPARSLVTHGGSSLLVLLGIVFAAQTVGLVWAVLGPLTTVESWLAAMLAASGSMLAAVVMVDDSPGRLALICLSSAALSMAMLAVARVCGNRVCWSVVSGQ